MSIMSSQEIALELTKLVVENATFSQVTKETATEIATIYSGMYMIAVSEPLDKAVKQFEPLT